jgi:hypothetical protein
VSIAGHLGPVITPDVLSDRPKSAADSSHEFRTARPPGDRCQASLFFYRYKAPLQAFETFLGQACAFDVVVFATFPEHHLALAEQIAEQHCSKQRMVGVVHNPQELHLAGACFHSSAKEYVKCGMPQWMRLSELTCSHFDLYVSRDDWLNRDTLLMVSP